MEFPEFGGPPFPYATGYPYLQPPSAHDYSSGESASSPSSRPFTPSLTVSPLTASTAPLYSPLSVDDGEIVLHTSTPDPNLFFSPPSLESPSPPPPDGPPTLSKRGLRGKDKVADMMKVVIEESPYGQLPLQEIISQIQRRFPDFSMVSQCLTYVFTTSLSSTSRARRIIFPTQNNGTTPPVIHRQDSRRKNVRNVRQAQRATKRGAGRSKRGVATPSTSTSDLQPVTRQPVSSLQTMLSQASIDPQPSPTQPTPDVGHRVSDWLVSVAPYGVSQVMPSLYPDQPTSPSPYFNIQVTMDTGFAPPSVHPYQEVFGTFGEVPDLASPDAPVDASYEDLFGLFLRTDPFERH
ncbi:hypothetical protein FRB99_000540 [Tulasnella sp. 403]|nr:hypothetical protein FRB99_000540 [Tulasnella sp. 403]